MPRPERNDAIAEVLAYYRDLGVTEVYLERTAAAEPPAGPRPEAPAVPTRPSRPAAAPPAPPAPAAPEPPSPAPPAAALPAFPSLAAARDAVAACHECRLASTRTQTVFSDGTGRSRLMFVGEAPGADEDAQGVPFVGRAGQLLTKMIEAGMGIPREDVYICNVLKCRPPGNRNPEPDEIRCCRKYLEAQVDLVRPAWIVALGKFAGQFLLGTDEAITRFRGRWGAFRGIPVMPTYHPSFLLRQPEKKKEVWEDLKLVLERMGRPVPKRG